VISSHSVTFSHKHLYLVVTEIGDMESIAENIVPYIPLWTFREKRKKNALLTVILRDIRNSFSQICRFPVIKGEQDEHG
jgi:hypothetical protein